MQVFALQTAVLIKIGAEGYNRHGVKQDLGQRLSNDFGFSTPPRSLHKHSPYIRTTVLSTQHTIIANQY